ncbi:MAG: signal peptidase II [Verrucomicrobiota bacterium]
MPPWKKPASASTGLGVGSRVKAYGLLWVLGIAIFVADQASKIWIDNKVPFDRYHTHAPGTDITVIPGFFYIIHVGNTGAAWSMFSGFPVLLALLAGATLIGIFFWRHSLGLKDRFTQICFGLLCGGIVGNLVDRLLHGHVIDFIDLHFGSYIYPTFNIADSGICVGVILYLWRSLRTPG